MYAVIIYFEGFYDHRSFLFFYDLCTTQFSINSSPLQIVSSNCGMSTKRSSSIFGLWMWIWVHYKMFRIIHGICWPKQNIQTYRKHFSCRMGGSRSPLCWWQAPCSQCWLQPYLSLLVITAHSRLQHFAPKIYLTRLFYNPYRIPQQVKNLHAEQSQH